MPPPWWGLPPNWVGKYVNPSFRWLLYINITDSELQGFALKVCWEWSWNFLMFWIRGEAPPMQKYIMEVFPSRSTSEILWAKLMEIKQNRILPVISTVLESGWVPNHVDQLTFDWRTGSTNLASQSIFISLKSRIYWFIGHAWSWCVVGSSHIAEKKLGCIHLPLIAVGSVPKDKMLVEVQFSWQTILLELYNFSTLPCFKHP